MPLLLYVIMAIVLGIVSGSFLSEPIIRIFITFNTLFSQLLGFLIPLIIVGLVTPAIGDVGRGAGKLLVWTIALTFINTMFSGFLAYGTGESLFPAMIANTGSVELTHAEELKPYFTLEIPPLLDVLSALVFSFMLGIAIAYKDCSTLKQIFCEFKGVVSGMISKAIIPLLPLYIFGIFLNMTYTGEVSQILKVFAQIIIVIFVLHIIIILYEYIIAGAIAKKNPFKLIINMLPAYFTALGTSSSAATIPITLRQTINNGVSEGVAGFVIPLCATIHLSGSMMKITACALTICMIHGMPHDPLLFLQFILLLSVCMIAAPGVPGGAIMAALGPLASILGFNADMQAFMIALYIAMDSFGTACNVTGDGAIAIILDKFRKTA